MIRFTWNFLQKERNSWLSRSPLARSRYLQGYCSYSRYSLSNVQYKGVKVILLLLSHLYVHILYGHFGKNTDSATIFIFFLHFFSQWRIHAYFYLRNFTFVQWFRLCALHANSRHVKLTYCMAWKINKTVISLINIAQSYKKYSFLKSCKKL